VKTFIVFLAFWLYLKPSFDSNVCYILLLIELVADRKHYVKHQKRPDTNGMAMRKLKRENNINL
jgi:hypothetical protein